MDALEVGAVSSGPLPPLVPSRNHSAEAIAAHAAGIAKAPWPTSKDSGTQVAQYFRILPIAALMFGRPETGLDNSKSGRLVLSQGRATSVTDAASFLRDTTWAKPRRSSMQPFEGKRSQSDDRTQHDRNPNNRARASAAARPVPKGGKG